MPETSAVPCFFSDASGRRVALLPWITSLLQSAERPGGVKIEFRDVEAAAAEITGSAASQLQMKVNATAVTKPPPSLPSIVPESDANLALVGIRIEIEKRLRQLAERRYLSTNQDRKLAP